MNIRYLTMVLAAVMTIFFVGCAKLSVDTKVKTSENYYPVPNNVSSIIRSYLLVPPGSNLQRFNSQSQIAIFKNQKNHSSALFCSKIARLPFLFLIKNGAQMLG